MPRTSPARSLRDGVPRGCRWALAAALLISPATGAPPPEQVGGGGLAALPALLQAAQSADVEVALRARRAAKEIVLGWLRAETPPGMRLVPGLVEVDGAGIRIEGGLYLGVHEVTVAEYGRFLAARGDAPAASAGAPDLPVTKVTLAEARAFADWREARLPTSEELHAAASGGGTFAYPWGGEFDPARANTREAGLGRAEPVGSRPRGNSPEGIADLAGNVAEWTETRVGEGRRARWLAVGGSFAKAQGRPGAATHKLRAEARLPDVGFRLARSLPELPAEAREGGGGRPVQD